ncbi:MAG: PSD1 and planctomycete cytochrome C domain-containing protein, partial [Planctomycetota bacterium]|nr:PSD1 and planctomycete cytochrome C domain-containing protein [Planctomycetota bacterium]
MRTTTPYLFILFFSLAAGFPSRVGGEEQVQFDRDIRPLFSDSCFACHGPDRDARKAPLRLDDATIALKKAIVPYKPDESPLIERLLTSDEDERMPPADSNRPRLSTAEVDLVRRWISQGAKFDEHWSYSTPERPSLQGLPGTGQEHPVDRFVLAGLKAAKRQPAGRADPRTLVRRLYFDLLGLPPSPAAVEEFSRDPSEQAFSALVDSLLSSPHFGERMAVHWLDLVRYADTCGIHSDNPISMSPFRDYVIRSFNSNKPFDRFTLEQLAGDLLPGAADDIWLKVASGYNRLNMMTTEGGAQDKEYLAKYAADRVRTTSTTWLGATLGCAECHDHKFDPYTTRDFYSFAAYFSDLEEKGYYPGAERTGEWGPRVKVPGLDHSSRLQEIASRLKELEGILEKGTPGSRAARAAWEKSLQQETVSWVPLKAAGVSSAGGTKLELKADGSVLASGRNPGTDTYTVRVSAGLGELTGIRLEVLPDPSLPGKGPGRAGNGNFVLSEIVARLEGGGGEAQSLEFSGASASWEQTSHGKLTPYGKWNARSAIDRDAKGANPGWAILPQAGKPNSAFFRFKEPLAKSAGGRQLVIELQQNHSNKGHTIGRFRLWGTTSAQPLQGPASVPDEILQLVHLEKAKRSAAQVRKLDSYYSSVAGELAEFRKESQALEKEKKAVESGAPTSLVSVSGKPREMRVLPRGDWLDESGAVVTPAVPAFLEEEGGRKAGRSREDLARWLTRKDNPLVSRVFVNRIWKMLMGAGIVKTLDDFGSQGSVPSHPELLDWLALEFVDSGWDVKRLLRTIVNSETYKRSSMIRRDYQLADPFNRELWRQGRLRLEAEFVRDNALAVSGLLSRRVGGVSVHPYQPAGYWAHLNFPKRKYKPGKGESLYRRGVYMHWQRTFLHPSLLAFDAPTREECTAERVISNTPQQA